MLVNSIPLHQYGFSQVTASGAFFFSYPFQKRARKQIICLAVLISASLKTMLQEVTLSFSWIRIN